MKQNMQKNTKLKIYISPTVKMVSFTVERGFAGTNDVKAEEARVYGDGNQVTGWTGWSRDLSSDNN